MLIGKLYLKNSDGYLCNSNFLGKLRVSIGIGLRADIIPGFFFQNFQGRGGVRAFFYLQHFPVTFFLFPTIHVSVKFNLPDMFPPFVEELHKK